MQKKQYRRFACCALVLSLTLAAKHSSATGLTRPNEIEVASDPSGAAVYATGKLLGITPLTVRLQDVFPVVFPPEQQDAYGKLHFAKEGCKEQTVFVSNGVIWKGVNAKLDCGQAELAKPKVEGAGATPPSVKERLLRLNGLRDQGLVSDEEYREIRRKILGEL